MSCNTETGVGVARVVGELTGLIVEHSEYVDRETQSIVACARCSLAEIPSLPSTPSMQTLPVKSPS
eukprot:1694341-Amphidinium_carterae.2